MPYPFVYKVLLILIVYKFSLNISHSSHCLSLVEKRYERAKMNLTLRSVYVRYNGKEEIL